MTIIFTKHAEDKFEVLKRHGVVILRHQVLETITNSERIDFSRVPLIIAQRPFDKNRVLRVVYRQIGETIKIITFYPGRRTQYEKNKH